MHVGRDSGAEGRGSGIAARADEVMQSLAEAYKSRADHTGACRHDSGTSHECRHSCREDWFIFRVFDDLTRHPSRRVRFAALDTLINDLVWQRAHWVLPILGRCAVCHDLPTAGKAAKALKRFAPHAPDAAMQALGFIADQLDETSPWVMLDVVETLARLQKDGTASCRILLERVSHYLDPDIQTAARKTLTS